MKIRRLAGALRWGSLVLVCLVPFWAQRSLDAYELRILKLILIYIMVGEAVNVINGLAGLFSLGHAAFVLIGGYVFALLTLPVSTKADYWVLEPLIWPFNSIECHFVPALLLSGLVAGIAGFVVALPALRFIGDYLTIATLAFGEIAVLLGVNLVSLTNGPVGIKGIPDRLTLPWIWGLCLLTVVFVSRLSRSSFGRALKCIRQDERVAEVMGVDLRRHKLIAFSLGSALEGIAGAAFASFFTNVDPLYFSFTFTFQVLIMVIIGGLGSVTGVVIAAPLITGFLEWARVFDSGTRLGSLRIPSLPGLRMIILSLILILVSILTKGGLMGDREFTWEGLLCRLSGLRQRP